ncbi:MAG: 50S ribosomal protein L9 [Bacteriovoracaceae bacterium]
MKVILVEKVKTLGNIGEIVNVSVGYARNFLFPKKVAILADEKNTKALNHQNRILAKKVAAHKKEALELKKKIEQVNLELIKKIGASGRLFGTVTNSELAQELSKLGIEVERRSIIIESPIKSLGSYEIKVKVFSDVEAKFKLKLIIDPVQAEELKKQQELAAKKKKEALENPEKTEEVAVAAEGEETEAVEASEETPKKKKGEVKADAKEAKPKKAAKEEATEEKKAKAKKKS